MPFNRPIPDIKPHGKVASSGISAIVQAEKLIQIALVLPSRGVYRLAGRRLDAEQHCISRGSRLPGCVFGGVSGLFYVIRMAMAPIKIPEPGAKTEDGPEREADTDHERTFHADHRIAPTRTRGSVQAGHPYHAHSRRAGVAGGLEGLGLAQRGHAGHRRGISAASIFEWQRLIRLINAKLDKQQTPRGARAAVVFFVLRLIVFAGAIYGSLKCFRGSVVALLCGLGLAVLAMVGGGSPASQLTIECRIWRLKRASAAKACPEAEGLRFSCLNPLP